MKTLICLLAVTTILCAQDFDMKEPGADVTVPGPGYRLVISREAFALRLYRGQSLDLEIDPSSLATTKLLRAKLEKGRSLQLEYFMKAPGATTEQPTTALITMDLNPGSISVSEWPLTAAGDLTPSVAFRLVPSGLWYGGGFQGWRDPQTFPLNEARISKTGFLAQGNTQGTPAWYTTKGVAVWVRNHEDFAYSFGDGLFRVSMPAASALRFDILLGSDIRDVSMKIIRAIGLPRAMPPADYFKLPIYTTWVEHKVPVSQAKVLEYARAIKKNELPCGVIEIDDKWEDRYGDMKFDREKFPDPKAMNAELHKLGYRVTLWVHPFVNVDSETYRSPRTRALLLRDSSRKPGLIKWWNGNAAVWDFTNPQAAAEFRSRLTALEKDYGFDGFKFDGGDVNFTPRDLRAYRQITAAEYCDVYNRATAAHFPWEETRVGVYSQPLGVVQRLIDKHSVWGRENGLAAILPEAITVSMRGFPFVMPDMIGGNQYDNDRIEKELLIRWAQASALMPLMQFSVGPWHFDGETVRLSRDASKMHVRFAPYIVELAAASLKTGEPILRPLWFNFPRDEACQSITDQFMLGTDVIVAPVLEKGAISRPVYLPAGRWRDGKTGSVMEGGRRIDYPAPLDTLPVFIREGSHAGK